MLRHIFKERGDAALQKIKRHPNWFHVPVLQMQETVDTLLKKKFTLDDIFNNVHILLYPLYVAVCWMLQSDDRQQ